MPKQSTFQELSCFTKLFAFFYLLTIDLAEGQFANRTWSGGGDAINWMDSNNWAGGNVPNEWFETAVFPDPGGLTVVTNNPPVNSWGANGINVSGSWQLTGTLTLDPENGGTNNDIKLNPNATLSIENLIGNSYANFSIDMVVDSGATLTLGDVTVADSIKIDGAGTAILTGTANLNNDGGSNDNLKVCETTTFKGIGGTVNGDLILHEGNLGPGSTLTVTQDVSGTGNWLIDTNDYLTVNGNLNLTSITGSFQFPTPVDMSETPFATFGTLTGLSAGDTFGGLPVTDVLGGLSTPHVYINNTTNQLILRAVPEPSSIMPLALLSGIALLKRRRKK